MANLKMYFNRKLLSILILACTSAACCLPQAVPAPALYSLSAKIPGNATASRQKYISSAPVLKLMPVYGSAPFVSTDIIYRHAHQGLGSYTLSRWSDAPVKMIETYLVEILGWNGPARAVLPPESTSTADILLEGMLYDFSLHLDSDSRPAGVVTMRFYLVNSDTRQLIATKDLSATIPARGTDAAHAVKAIDRAVQDICGKLTVWLSQELK